MMQDREKQLYRARLLAVVAATVISLACGSNYVFSAWGPQFASRMHFSSTETNLIATFGNLGMYLLGIPVGILTDKRGVKPGVLAGSVLVGLGYFMLYKAYDWGPGSVPLWLLCIYMFFTGAGGCAAFAGAIKTSAMNWPHHRGTATAFPLAAFGLSAFLFASLSTIVAPNDVGEFLLILSIGCFCLIFLPSFFLQIVPFSRGYKPLPNDVRRDSAKLDRIESNNSRKALLNNRNELEPGASSSVPIPRSSLEDNDQEEDGYGGEVEVEDEDEGGANRTPDNEEVLPAESAHKSVYTDVQGPQMLKYVEFYQYFLLLGLMCGIGLMTINNIGNDAEALWAKFDPKVDPDTIRHRQSIHVSILSVCSFIGRLTSGIGSDLVVKKLHLSRVWCLFGSSVVFVLAQIFGLAIENPNWLFLLSSLTGLAYGFLFGCFPSIIAETFGVGGLTTNWGVLTLAPVLFANIFNLMYGSIYDSHSHIRDDNRRECLDGRFCYHEAYWGTFVAGMAAAGISLWSIRHQYKVKVRLGWKGEGDDNHLA